MRGDDQQQSHIFSYLSPEERVRKDHPLRTVRAMVDEVLQQLSPRFDAMYAKVGRPSIPPEQLLRAQLLQMLYSIRSERLLMEEIDYSMLFRWFIGLNLDDKVWDATVFTKTSQFTYNIVRPRAALSHPYQQESERQHDVSKEQDYEEPFANYRRPGLELCGWRVRSRTEGR